MQKKPEVSQTAPAPEKAISRRQLLVALPEVAVATTLFLAGCETQPEFMTSADFEEKFSGYQIFYFNPENLGGIIIEAPGKMKNFFGATLYPSNNGQAMIVYNMPEENRQTLMTFVDKSLQNFCDQAPADGQPHLLATYLTNMEITVCQPMGSEPISFLFPQYGNLTFSLAVVKKDGKLLVGLAATPLETGGEKA